MQKLNIFYTLQHLSLLLQQRSPADKYKPLRKTHMKNIARYETLSGFFL